MTRPKARQPHTLRKSNVGYCKDTHKRRFRDELEAKMALSRIRSRSSRDTMPVRTYLCKFCKGVHLTSQQKNSTID